MAKLSVHLVAWNGAKYIPYLFESLRRQTYKDWELLAVDNASAKDNTVELIEKELKDFPVPARLVRNGKNLGFAGGHNQAVRLSLGRAQGLALCEYFQLLNQDMYLAPDYFEKVVAMMEAHPEAGAGQGLLLRWNFSSNQHTEAIDTMGLKVMRSRRVVDWRAGEIYGGPSSGAPEDGPHAIEVFGVSGALPIYRRKAIEEVMFEDQMFDEDFFMYKEDVDLAFRLRSAGWKAYVEASARAWHDRTAAGPREMADRAAIENRKGRAAYVNYYSYRNHLVVLLKNEHHANFVHDWLWIVWYEFKKFVYLFFTDWATLQGLWEVCRLWRRTMQKRRFIMTHYCVKPEEMRRWFF